MDSGSLGELARSEVLRILPAAGSVRTQVLAEAEDQAIVIAEPVVNGRRLAPLQILLLRVEDQWVVWQTGAYGSWMEMEGQVGVVVRPYRADPDATAVRFGDQLSKTLQIGTERNAHAVLWSVPAKGQWDWPPVEEVVFADGGQRPISSRLAITKGHLTREYIAEMLGEAAWAWNVLADLVDHDPGLALEVVIKAVDQARDEDVISRIGAGLLESLVRNHGHVLDDALASAAASSAAVRLALQSVWAKLPPRTAVVGRSTTA